MTTPEKLRRRQRTEEALLLVVMIILAVQYIVFKHQVNSQQECMADQFSQLTKSFTARSAITAADSKSKTNVILGIAKHQGNPDVQRAALNEFIVDQKKINDLRNSHPVPPFPPGRCG